MELYILHAGINHPSPYFYNFCEELKKYDDVNVIINPDLPSFFPESNGIVYFNRLKRFYNSQDINSAHSFLKKIDALKREGWKIVWTIHNFFPIDRKITEVDDYIVKEFISRADLLFTLTDYMKDKVYKIYNKKAVNHFMGINKLDGCFDKKVIDLSFIPKDSFLFSFVGNIYKYKQLDVLINSFNRLENSNAYLLIAGPEAQNCNININKIIKDSNNPNIIRIPEFIGDSDWESICSKTNVFVNLYDLKDPAFKYGFFPSNYVKLSMYNKIIIAPNSLIIKELLDCNALLLYNEGDNDDLFRVMQNAIQNKEKLKIQETLIKNKSYSWEKTVSIFIYELRKLIND